MSQPDPKAFEQLLLSRPESIEQLIDEMVPELYAALKLAVELGKWSDGRRLDADQKALCMQAVILYEARHVAESDRIGFDLSATCKSKPVVEQPRVVTVSGSGSAQNGAMQSSSMPSRDDSKTRLENT